MTVEDKDFINLENANKASVHDTLKELSEKPFIDAFLLGQITKAVTHPGEEIEFEKRSEEKFDWTPCLDGKEAELRDSLVEVLLWNMQDHGNITASITLRKCSDSGDSNHHLYLIIYDGNEVVHSGAIVEHFLNRVQEVLKEYD